MNNLSDIKILLIQNTTYHFETMISLYTSLKRLNPKSLKVVQITGNYTEQQNFLNFYNINHNNDQDYNIYDYDIAFIISAYPNPHVNINDSIPESHHPLIQYYQNKTIYVCHRFDKEKDYEVNPFINKTNSIALSPIASNIQLDFFYPIENVVDPVYCNLTEIKNLCIQGHFELKNRITNHDIFSCSSKFNLNIIGTNFQYLHAQQCPNHAYHMNLNELSFYSLLNSVQFILPMIDDNIKFGTYIRQRFSSNFNHAMALEKPVFAHECFKDIYEIPGIYYNNSNIKEMFDTLLNMSQEQYSLVLADFKIVKNKYYIHNNKILSNKILSIVK